MRRKTLIIGTKGPFVGPWVPLDETERWVCVVERMGGASQEGSGVVVEVHNGDTSTFLSPNTPFHGMRARCVLDATVTSIVAVHLMEFANMPKFSQKSLEKLATCHIDLQTICNEVIKEVDFTILEGFRDEAAQNKAFEEGKSKLKWPRSKHNHMIGNKPMSLAVDIAPYPIDWNDRERFAYLAGHMLMAAASLRSQGRVYHKLRWGGDWDADDDLKENRRLLDDLPHFELVEP